MLGQVEIDDFWTNVERELCHELPDLSSEQRLRAIMAYRNALASVEVNQMVYHREPSDVAHDILVGEFATFFGGD